MSSSSSSSVVVVKVFFNNETHRLIWKNPVEFGFTSLIYKIAERVKKPAGTFVLKYEDQEQDRVTLTCDEDLIDALHIAQDMKASALKVYVNLSSDPVDKSEFVLLHSGDVKGNDVGSGVPAVESNGARAVIAGPSFEQLNEDLQKLLDEKLKIVDSEVKKDHEVSRPTEVAQVFESIPLLAVPCVESTPSQHLSEIQSAKVVAEEPQAQAVHEHVTCDVCGQNPINGVRFKCVECVNYDLCSSCEAKGVHPASHPLLKIKIPRSAENADAICGSGRRGGRCGRSRSGRAFARFVEDVTIPDRSSCAPGETKQKIWKLQNVGHNDWPAGFKAVALSGEEVIDEKSREVLLPSVKAGEVFEVRAKVNAPTVPGRYVANFKLANSSGEKFGPKIWVDFYVPEVAASKKPEPEKKVEEVPEKSPEEIKYKSELEELASMGFNEVGLNLYLLDKFEGKCERVVHWLLDKARSN